MLNGINEGKDPRNTHDTKNTNNMHEQILEELNETRSSLVKVLTSIEKEQVNVIPFEGSWSAAQLTEHILKSLKGVLNIMHGPVRETKREPTAKLMGVKQAMLDSNARYTAPGFLNPSTLIQDQQVLVDSIETKMQQISEAFQQLNPNETCTAYELPGAGTLTRLEWVYFVIYHTQRHTRQMENIRRQLAGV
ncbi:MAG TPA: DinB family protein [Chitinophagaceae bacterium]|nr:DinB family protein [Chitinophagaceae bacterium]